MTADTISNGVQAALVNQDFSARLLGAASKTSRPEAIKCVYLLLLAVGTDIGVA